MRLYRLLPLCFFCVAACLCLLPVPAECAEDGPPESRFFRVEGNATLEAYPNLGPFLDKYYTLKRSVEDAVGDFQFNFSFTGYYQWQDYAEISGIKYGSNDGMGFVADFWINWFPVEGGTFYAKLRYGQGRGSARDMEENGATLANFNEVACDVTGNHLRLHNIYYTQEFLRGDFFVAAGKADPEMFIDLNRYANDEYSQFMGQPFVADPVLDNEDTHAPMVAVGGSPFGGATITGYVGSNTEGGEKGLWDDPWEGPFVAMQAAYDTDALGRSGTYRLVGFSATYPHEKLDGSGTAPGYGVGLNFNQELTGKVGVFGRAYWHNEVYNMPWAFSLGLSATGLVPTREHDTLGLAAAALVADDVVHTGGAETHLEAYYRFALWDCLYPTPDLQYVIDPQGESSNDNILSAILRMQLLF